MANSNGWGDGAANNAIGWGQGANNAIGWGDSHAKSWAGLTDISGAPTTDADAQAFITAAAITDPTQQAAINTLVVDLKGYNVWTKMKALYPFCGSTASQQKFNLKDPRDLDAAFRLQFNGGWTHSSTGATPNGTNAYARTFLTPSTILTPSSKHLSFYQRTENVPLNADPITMGALFSGQSNFLLAKKVSTTRTIIGSLSAASISNTLQPSIKGLSLTTRSSTTNKLFFNGTSIGTSTGADYSPACNIFIGALFIDNVTIYGYTNDEISFSSIGDGLTDTEAANFYTAVQSFQTTLGRSIGAQTVSDADAQAFVTNAGIVDQIEANAVNNLVIGMKADGLWTKMKACYPMVGGSSSTMKFNLKNPLDTDAAFRLVFNGGWTFSSNGATPNGTNAYADTKLTGNLLQQNSTHLSIYSRTDTNGSFCDIGADSSSANGSLSIWSRLSNLFYNQIHNVIGNYLTISNTSSYGLHIANRTASTTLNSWKNGVKLTTGSNASSTPHSRVILLGALNDLSSVGFFSPRQQAFATIGDGLTDTDATNLNSRVTTFQTALNRNV